MKRTNIVPEFVSNMQSNASCTMSTQVGGAINTLSMNKDNSLVVVGGRSILKIYNVDEINFKEKMNMRAGRRQGLNLSCADVAWNHINENLISTAATNGAIICWDLNTSPRNKQMAIFTEHKRTVTKVCFHSAEPGRLLSGSQDGTMKMFDLRKRECVSTFASKSDGVRCVQFCPHEYFQFGASFDNGSVQVWDYRNTNTCMMQFIAHKGSVYTIEWHPDQKEKQRLATGGRDNMIKIWDMVDNRMHECGSIATNSLVAVARWRSQRKDQIASVAMMLDHSITVWDTRRPYMPFALFTEHTDVTTGIVWKKNDPELLYSCSKDGTLYQHCVKDAYRPSEHCNLSGLALGARGEIAYASTESTTSFDSVPNPKLKSVGRFGFKSVVGPLSNSQQKNEASSASSSQTTSMNSKFLRFLNAKSDLALFVEGDRANMDICSANIVNAANLYKLQGMPFDELCSYNADIAIQLGMNFDADIWKYMKLFFGGQNKIDQAKSNAFPPGNCENTTFKARESTHSRNLKNGIGTGESNCDDSDQHSDPDTEHSLTDIAKGHATSELDCYYSEEEPTSDLEYGGRGMSSGPEGYLDQQEWLGIDDSIDGILPSEAFQRRLVLQQDGLDNHIESAAISGDDEIPHGLPITIPNPKKHASFIGEKRKRKKSNSVTAASLEHADSQSSSPSENFSTSPVVYITSFENPSLSLDYKANLLASMFLAMDRNPNNIQILVCGIIVLCSNFPSLTLPIDHLVVEHWQLSYMEIVSRYELWNHFTEIVNLSTIPAIMNMNSSSTIHTSCGQCRKRMPQKHAWICGNHGDNDHEQCRSGITCALCQNVVRRGLYVWCQGCCHGGHIKCMEDWFRYPFSQGLCPKGCGHVCGLSR